MVFHNFWSSIILLGIGTFCIRASFIYMSSRLNISIRMREILSFIPCAIFPALITPMVFFHQGQSHLLMHKERVFALIFASFVSYKTKNILVTILTGLVLLFFFTML